MNGSNVLFKVENVIHKSRWPHECYRLDVLSKQKDSSQVFLISNLFSVDLVFANFEHYLNENGCSRTCTPSSQISKIILNSDTFY